MITEDNQIKMQSARKGKGTLTDTFVHDGLLYKRLEDKYGELQPGFYIYTVNDSWNNSWYEAFYTTNDKLPNDEAFGKTAYRCKSLDDAWRCIGVLEAKIKNRFERRQNKDENVPESLNFY